MRCAARRAMQPARTKTEGGTSTVGRFARRRDVRDGVRYVSLEALLEERKKESVSLRVLEVAFQYAA